MAKKNQQSSGPSYSLLALLKRTLFLHETSKIDELVEEVHEYMLKDQSYEQIKERYIGPILKSNPSFQELDSGSNEWKLTEGNKVNDAVYDVFKKYKTPLSERQILNRIAKVEHIAGNIQIKLDLKNDARFSDLEGGKYWILSEWVVINEYARSLLMKHKSGLTEKDVVQRVVAEYGIEKDSAIFLPMMDERFVQKEKKWVLRRFVEPQKSKLRPSQIDRLYQHLLKVGRALSSHELTASVLNIPANLTDVDEKLAQDPRFAVEEGNWDLRSRVKLRQIQMAEQEEQTEAPAPEIPTKEETRSELPGDRKIPASAEDLPLANEELEVAPEVSMSELLEQSGEEIAKAEQAAAAAIDIVTPEQEVGVDKPVQQAEQADQAEAPELIQEDVQAVREAQTLSEMIPEAADQTELTEKAAEEVEEAEETQETGAAQEREAEPEEEMAEEGEYIEALRNKVVDFLQDAFHTEGVVYNADIIDQFVTSENREEFFHDFIRNHFVNPAKERVLTPSELLKFLVYFAEPTLNDKVIDPCCGTGGFLLQILETLDEHLQEAEWTERDFSLHYELRTGQFYFVKINEEEREYFEFPLDDAVARWLPIIRFCKQQQLTGVDIDRFACRTADLNLAIQGFPEIVLHQDDALSSKQIGSGVYDIVIGAPPASEDKPTRFLRKSLLLAKPGGKILLLLPNEMFHDHRLVSATLRNQIIAQTIVKAVIRFPESENSKVYGSGCTLLYCLRKHHEAVQHSDILVGDVTSFDLLRDVLEVLEEPDAPVCQDDTPISGRILDYILSSYQSSAYNLLLESLRRRALRGNMLSTKEWNRMKKSEKTHRNSLEE